MRCFKYVNCKKMLKLQILHQAHLLYTNFVYFSSGVWGLCYPVQGDGLRFETSRTIFPSTKVSLKLSENSSKVSLSLRSDTMCPILVSPQESASRVCQTETRSLCKWEDCPNRRQKLFVPVKKNTHKKTLTLWNGDARSNQLPKRMNFQKSFKHSLTRFRFWGLINVCSFPRLNLASICQICNEMFPKNYPVW